MRAILAGHPAIKAVSPQAPVTDWFIGDDFHHNGAFMLMDGFSFYSGFGKVRPQPTTEGQAGFSQWNTSDNYDFYLRAGALSNFTRKFDMGKIPFWNDLMSHPIAARRSDVLVYKTGVLTEPLTVTGPVIADLWSSISTTDVDFVVKLIDVFPDTLQGMENNVPLGGYRMLVRGEIFRGRYRESFENPKAFEPNKVNA